MKSLKNAIKCTMVISALVLSFATSESQARVAAVEPGIAAVLFDDPIPPSGWPTCADMKKNGASCSAANEGKSQTCDNGGNALRCAKCVKGKWESGNDTNPAQPPFTGFVCKTNIQPINATPVASKATGG